MILGSDNVVRAYGRTFLPTKTSPIVWECDDAVLLAVGRTNVEKVDGRPIMRNGSYHSYILVKLAKRSVRIFSLIDHKNDVRILKVLPVSDAVILLTKKSHIIPGLPKLLREKVSARTYLRQGQKYPSLESLFAEMLCPWLRELDRPMVRLATDMSSRYDLSASTSDRLWRSESLRSLVRRMTGSGGSSVVAAARAYAARHDRDGSMFAAQLLGRPDDPPMAPERFEFFPSLFRKLDVARYLRSPERMVEWLSNERDLGLERYSLTLVTILVELSAEPTSDASRAWHRRVVGWMLTEEAGWCQNLVDGWNSYKEYPNQIELPAGARSSKEFHDAIVEQYNVADDAANGEPFRYGPVAASLDGLRAGEMTLRLAESAAQVKRWGKEMKHCIGTYAKRAKDGELLLGAVVELGEETHNFEMDLTGRLVQVHGPRNAAMPADRVKELQEAVRLHVMSVSGVYDLSGQKVLHRDWRGTALQLDPTGSPQEVV